MFVDKTAFFLSFFLPSFLRLTRFISLPFLIFGIIWFVKFAQRVLFKNHHTLEKGICSNPMVKSGDSRTKLSSIKRAVLLCWAT